MPLLPFEQSRLTEVANGLWGLPGVPGAPAGPMALPRGLSPRAPSTHSAHGRRHLQPRDAARTTPPRSAGMTSCSAVTRKPKTPLA
jgi:hypothetical protein